MAGMFGIQLPGLGAYGDPTQDQVAQMQAVGSGMFGAPATTPSAGGGMSPYLRMALQALAGGFSGSANAQRTGAKGFGAGLGPGAVGGLQYGFEAQQADRRNKYLDQQDRYLQSKVDAEQRASDQEVEQQKRINDYIATLPPEQQQMARLAPKEIIAAQVGQMYPKPSDQPDPIKEYEYAVKGGYTGDFNTWFLQSKKASAPSTSVTVGGTNVQMPYPLEKSVIADQQKQQFNESEQLASLQQIQSSFNPKWLTLGPRAGQALNSLKEFVGIPLSGDQQKDLADYTQFRQNTVENFNKLVKTQTGTALSPGEAERITKQTPNAGTGIFDGDAPTPFKAKMDNGIRLLKLGLMRRHFALKQGMDPLATGIDLADVPQLIERRGAELEAGLRQQMPGITDEQLKMEVANRLRNEFGTGQ